MAKPSITKRVTKGSALTYAELDTNFQNLTDATVTLRVPGSGGRIAKTVSVFGTPTISSATFKFGGASLSKDVNDYLTIPTSADFAFGTGDFTVEMWVTRSRSGFRERLIEFRTNEVATLTPMLEIDSLDRLVYLTAGTVRIQGGELDNTTGWHHVAVSRVSGVTRLFLDGVQIGSNYTDTSNYSQHPCYIGRSVGGLFGYNGYIDELRISKNTGRYTTTFTPSTTAFVNDASTVLLLHFDTDYLDDAAATPISVVSDLNGVITLVEGAGIDITGDNTAKTITITATGGGLGTGTGGISALVDDPIPTLGGDLNVNGFAIVSSSNGNITLTPNGTGDVILSADRIQVGDLNTTATIQTNGTGSLTLTSGGNVTITTGSNDDIFLQTDTVRVGNSIAAQIFALEGEDLLLGVLDTTPGATYGGIITVTSGANGNIIIDPDGTGTIELKAPLKVNATSGTPTLYENGYYDDMLMTPVSWLKIDIGGSYYYLPLFQ
jgi:hypothetical protein